MVLSKNNKFVDIEVYGAKTEPGIRITVCKLNSVKSFLFILVLALSVPNKKPSGRITAARPFFLSLYIITDINKSAVSDDAKSDGK